ncbi:MAG: hypothetical protein PHI59_07875 [Candidatus Omnitrophica bacterium]|nr:hypothetical protein [Candidatus Omnitrophota bacterium]
MKDKNLDAILKTYFTKKIALPEKSGDCPSAEALAQYVLGTPSVGELYDIGNHIKSCKSCAELVEGALLYSAYGKDMKLENVPAKVKNTAKSLNPDYRQRERGIMGYFKKNLWLLLSLASFTASFFTPRHFLQFLILTILFGLKWVFNKETTRTLIMVYNAWKKHDKDGSRDLEEIFKNRF